MTLAAKVVVSECMPHTFQGRQSHRANPDSNSPSDFYRLTITIPILDHLNSQLEERFDGSSVSSKLLTEFIKLLPSEIFKNKSKGVILLVLLTAILMTCHQNMLLMLSYKLG